MIWKYCYLAKHYSLASYSATIRNIFQNSLSGTQGCRRSNTESRSGKYKSVRFSAHFYIFFHALFDCPVLHFQILHPEELSGMHLLEAGVNLVYIRDLLGHTSILTTEIYARTNPKIKEEQLKKNSTSINATAKYGKKEKEDLIDWLKKAL